MLKIDNATAKATRDAIDPAGTEGWFTEGNPGLAEAATIVPADFLNDLQANLREVIDAGSITPTKGPGGDTDLLDALSAIINTTAPAGLLVGELEGTSNTVTTLRASSGTDVLVEIDNAVLSAAGSIAFDMASHLDAGETASTAYYLYLRNLAGVLDQQISATAPDLPGGTKPGYKAGDTSRRCVGSRWNNLSQHLVECTYHSGGLVLFESHDGNHEHRLLDSQSTGWRSVTVAVPETATTILFSAASATGSNVGMVCYAKEGATGSLTSGSIDPADSGFEDAELWASHGGAGDQSGVSVHGEIRVVTPATPRVYYGITRDLRASSHNLLVRGYRDRFTPR